MNVSEGDRINFNVRMFLPVKQVELTIETPAGDVHYEPWEIALRQALVDSPLATMLRDGAVLTVRCGHEGKRYDAELEAEWGKARAEGQLCGKSITQAISSMAVLHEVEHGRNEAQET
jgi:hypothetical protein